MALSVGDLVRKVNMPARVGKILDIVHDAQLQESLARVQFGDGVETCLLSNLELFGAGPQDMWQDLIKLRVSGAIPFRTLLTFVRIKTPPSPIISAFGTARVRFYPYQFKPLLKFLENPNQRLLIADDVGLGKTIEAGYVLREWRARHGLQNVLVVVPARLMSKWKNELQQRFEEHFEIVDSREIKNTLARVTKGFDLPEFNWIASYETLRATQITRLLDEVRPSLDLLIMDEAHRVRNRKTNQYRCAAVLKDCADAMIYLTATPVQTGMDNLYTLASLLMPDMFESKGAFDDILEANRPIVRACHLISQRKLTEAANELESLENHRLTKALSEDPYFKDVVRRLRSTETQDRAALVRLQRDACEFSLLGHLLSRTRKAEVMENWPVREAQNPHIELTDAEREIYNSVRHIVRILSPQTSGWGATMAAVTAYRYTASCIPAAVEYFRERLALGELLPGTRELSKEEEKEFLEALKGQDEEWEAGIDVTKELGRIIQHILSRCPAPGKDSKYQALLAVINKIWDFDRVAKNPRRKIVIFSYFRRTLEYLRKQLSIQSIATRVIHGDVPMSERLDYIEEFLASSEINILLSSEVGGEGIDLQRASVIVNYDLPWNPMVVEQRIGRIDRIGQMADKMVIVNLVAEGTIEQRILLRLYERIGLFREAIGELDDIIGPMDLQNLLVDALRGDLSEEQIQKRIDSTAKAAEEKLGDAGVRSCLLP
ncbi:MAG TPA: SNF2-related protein [Syntrophales bacterium]|jgi:SNF2 family DNA or RNA helicase|nr:SNF2-related protein [Syntrophales bacterium]